MSDWRALEVDCLATDRDDRLASMQLVLRRLHDIQREHAPAAGPAGALLARNEREAKMHEALAQMRLAQAANAAAAAPGEAVVFCRGPSLQLRVCVVCRDEEVDAALGVACADGHFFCNACLQAAVLDQVSFLCDLLMIRNSPRLPPPPFTSVRVSFSRIYCLPVSVSLYLCIFNSVSVCLKNRRGQAWLVSVSMILNTDMAYHFELLKQFKARVSNQRVRDDPLKVRFFFLR